MTIATKVSRVRRWLARSAAVVMTAVLLLLVRVQAASAAPADGDQIGQTPPALSWITLTDSHGISMWNYELSLDRGGVTSPDKFFWAAITDACWGAYRSWCALALWFLDWVLSFDWLHTIASPLLATGDAMQSVVDRVGAVPVLLTITAVVAVCWMARGRYATGIWELGTALVIAALATGVFAQPVQMVAGSNGLIMKTQQTGLELSAALATGGGSTGQSPDQLRKAQTGQLVDTFIRQPTEMINFGKVLDGGKCAKVYDDVLKKGPYGSASDIRDRVGECDSAAGDYAAQPTASMALGSIVFMPASFIILLLTIVLAGSVIAAACYAMFQSLKAILTLVTGLLPGGGKGSLLLTFAEAAISLLIILFTTVFLGVFLLVIQAMFKSGANESVPKTFVIVDVILIVGIVIYWRQRKRLKESAQRLAEWMSKRPGGAPATRLPERHGSGLGSAAGSAVRTVTSLAQLRATRSAARSAGGIYNIDARRQAAFLGANGHVGEEPGGGDGDLPFYPASGGSGPRGGGGGGGGGGGPRKQLPGPSVGVGRIEARKGKVVGGLVRLGGGAALAYATGGASTVVTGSMTAARASKAVNSARRAAVLSRMALPSGPAGRPAPQGPMPNRTKATPSGSRASGRVIQGTVLSSSTGPAAAGGKRAGKTAGKTPASSRPTKAPHSDLAAQQPRPVPRRQPRAEAATPTPKRQWDKVVRPDGTIVLVPKAIPAPSDSSPAVDRSRRRGRRGR
ncbi:MAG: integral membrane sensor protein [Intrasporangium sp.]|uniref:integral membrane sensor protein n=1 Tax=Intrasporangium sp. TaxID=1925024 RepID=UPI0026496E5B|nr:integral membrane sensor protein [Intrasporangium sp.]MDN5798115.1 integral membrane sensor protein [Intrasporangium sp.]